MTIPPTQRLASRLTIGVLASDVYDDIPRTMWRGITDAAREREVNLIYYSAGVQRAITTWQGSLLYELIDPALLDGLIIIPSTLMINQVPGFIAEFIQRLSGLPMISLDDIFGSTPCVLKDNYRGMVDVLAHLVDVHDRRRIILMPGPVGFEGVEERFHACKDFMTRRGLPFDPDLVTPALKSWQYEDALELFQKYLETHGLRPRTDFDAVAAVNDESAMAVITVLQRMGVHVPEDVAVTGFDDLDLAGVSSPPLTTARPPFYHIGRQAVDLLLAKLRGDFIPEKTMVPSQVIVRHSCGCLLPTISKTVVGDIQVEDGLSLPHLAEWLASRRGEVIRQIADTVSATPVAASRARQLLNGFLGEIGHGVQHAFLSALDDILGQVAADGGYLEEWQNAISVLRRCALEKLDDAQAIRKIEDLCQQGRVMVGEMAWRAHARRRLVSEERERDLRVLGTVLATHLDLDELFKVLAAELPALGFSRCYLSLYENPQNPLQKARLVLGYDERGVLDIPDQECIFPSRQLMPEQAWLNTRPYQLFLEMLSFRDENLGFVLFETTLPAGRTAGKLFDGLRVQISNSIKAALLYHDVQQARQVAEDRRELAEQANRLKSHFLSMVSHELRTPLNVIAGLSENIAQEKIAGEQELPERVRRDLQHIHASAQHLDGLIRDVLDLASSHVGQLKLVMERLDVIEALKPALMMGERMAREKGLVWKCVLPPDLPTVTFDRTRLRQVALNLISNAVKFTRQGEIVFQIELTAEKLVFSVIDTGLGIPLEDQKAIFEEFRRSERTAARGYGGMGLGLAICRRLVEMGGGEIGVESAGFEGSGSNFYFTLPVTVGGVNPIAVGQPRAQQVLLLTQRSNQTETLRLHLKEAGYEVEEVQLDAANHWLEEIVQNPPGAVILDFEPAAEVGWEIVNTLKANPATQELPVIFYAMFQDAGAMVDVNYLAKPVARAALAGVLEKQGFSRELEKDQKTILIVDDEKAVLDLHTRLVEDQLPGCRVLHAANGKQALEVMRTDVPDLVLLDLMMPEMDGFTVLEQMREIKKMRSVPVIVLTSQKLTDEEMQLLNQGVAAVLGKGLFSAQETLTQIERSLSRNKNLGTEARRIARRAMVYIHDHYADALGRKEIAAHVGVSQEHLSSCFHREVGVPLVNYVERYRLLRAKELLLTTEKSITEIALEVGFNDSSYFGRIFRRENGISPLAFRRGAGN